MNLLEKSRNSIHPSVSRMHVFGGIIHDDIKCYDLELVHDQTHDGPRSDNYVVTTINYLEGYADKLMLFSGWRSLFLFCCQV